MHVRVLYFASLRDAAGRDAEDVEIASASLAQLYDEARASVAEAKLLVDNLNKGKGTAGKLLTDDELYKQFNLITAKVNTAVDKINSGQGTIGQLIVNPQLYDGMTAATREVTSLLKDVHSTPKKYLSIKLALF